MISEKPYKEGTIKLTWISSDENLNSKMFENINDALSEISSIKDGSNFLLMKLLKTDGVKYSWELLPYGDFKKYAIGKHIMDNKFKYIVGLSIFLIGLFIYNKKH